MADHTRESLARTIDPAIYTHINPLTGQTWEAALSAADAVLAADYVHRDEIEHIVRREAAKELEQLAQDEAEDMLSESDYGPDATVYRAVTVASILERAEAIRNG